MRAGLRYVYCEGEEGWGRVGDDCWEVMHTLGIRKVFYSTGIGTWTCEKVASMETTHRSSGVLALAAYKEQESVEKKRRRS